MFARFFLRTESFRNENEAPRTAQRHKSPSPGGGRSTREARRVGVKARASALRLPASPRTPPRAPTVRDPPPAGEGEKSDPVLATRQRPSFMPGEVRMGETRLHSSPSPFAFLFLHKRRREAERRQTQVTNRRILRCGARSFGARTLDGVPPRLSARGEYLIPKAQLQARLPGTWSARALPAFACPSPATHLAPRS